MLSAYFLLLNLLSLFVFSSNNNKCCCWSCCYCCCCCCCCPTSAHFTLTEWALKVEIALCYLQLLSHFSFFRFFPEKKFDIFFLSMSNAFQVDCRHDIVPFIFFYVVKSVQNRGLISHTKDAQKFNLIHLFTTQHHDRKFKK